MCLPLRDVIKWRSVGWMEKELRNHSTCFVDGRQANTGVSRVWIFHSFRGSALFARSLSHQIAASPFHLLFKQHLSIHVASALNGNPHSYIGLNGECIQWPSRAPTQRNILDL